MSPPRDGEDSPDDGPADHGSLPDNASDGPSQPADGSPSDDDSTRGDPAHTAPADDQLREEHSTDDLPSEDHSDDEPTTDDSSAADPLDPDRAATSGSEGNPSRESDTERGVAPNGAGGTVDAPPARRTDADAEREGSGALRTFVIDVLSSAIAVLLVGVLLFAVSGVWPPMVAVESPSMTPHMKTGDLVFVMEEQRFPGDGAIAGTGVVTAQTGERTDYRKFAKTGDVIVYKPDGSESATPIIHRAMFWVNESENWYEKADKQSIGRYSECGDTPDDALPNCPAPHAGFVTKGDANGVYDQAQTLSGPVKPAWVVGTAEVRVPKLGCIRLRSEGCADGMLGLSAPAAGATTFERSCLCNETAG
ncbi:S26 family signal peptidase [Halosimplex sp. TS25]|uniref:S26 family signal peptidase n=1 Tax=Halosimplex rarum TaxID=3396619 RepID=UPI0039EA02DA